jgi:predicted pyridoxine 5'-phosphate oxidase superfamily flavin-nucleotide-binding protein
MRVLDEIDDTLAAWIARQPLFFVASAPLAADGHVNVSPKGPGSTLRVLGPDRVAYLDYTGSGAETTAHLRENGRIVVMLCAFDGPPQVIRLHGTGEVIRADDARFAPLMEHFADEPLPRVSLRAVIVVEVERVSKSCGYTVPLMAYDGERPHMPAWTEKKLRTGGPEALDDYRAQKNATSIDGLPSVPVAGD